MVGLTNSIGVIGAIAGEGPFAHMVTVYGWQESLIIVGAIGLMISVFIFFGVKNHPLCITKPKDCVQILERESDHSIKNTIREVMRDRKTWLTAIYAGLIVAPIYVFPELWSVSFLTKAHHLTKELASDINSFVFIGIGVGGPLNGLFSRLIKRRRPIMLLGNLGAIACLMSIIFIKTLSVNHLYALMFGFGFFSSSMLLAFSINKERHPASHSATVTAFTNMVISLIGAIAQPSISYLLDHLGLSSKPGNYSVADFHMALTTLPIILGVALILLFFLRQRPHSASI